MGVQSSTFLARSSTVPTNTCLEAKEEGAGSVGLSAGSAGGDPCTSMLLSGGRGYLSRHTPGARTGAATGEDEEAPGTGLRRETLALFEQLSLDWAFFEREFNVIAEALAKKLLLSPISVQETGALLQPAKADELGGDGSCSCTEMELPHTPPMDFLASRHSGTTMLAKQQKAALSSFLQVPMRWKSTRARSCPQLLGQPLDMKPLSSEKKQQSPSVCSPLLSLSDAGTAPPNSPGGLSLSLRIAVLHLEYAGVRSVLDALGYAATGKCRQDSHWLMAEDAPPLHVSTAASIRAMGKESSFKSHGLIHEPCGTNSVLRVCGGSLARGPQGHPGFLNGVCHCCPLSSQTPCGASVNSSQIPRMRPVDIADGDGVKGVGANSRAAFSAGFAPPRGMDSYSSFTPLHQPPSPHTHHQQRARLVTSSISEPSYNSMLLVTLNALFNASSLNTNAIPCAFSNLLHSSSCSRDTLHACSMGNYTCVPNGHNMPHHALKHPVIPPKPCCALCSSLHPYYPLDPRGGLGISHAFSTISGGGNRSMSSSDTELFGPPPLPAPAAGAGLPSSGGLLRPAPFIAPPLVSPSWFLEAAPSSPSAPAECQKVLTLLCTLFVHLNLCEEDVVQFLVFLMEAMVEVRDGGVERPHEWHAAELGEDKGLDFDRMEGRSAGAGTTPRHNLRASAAALHYGAANSSCKHAASEAGGTWLAGAAVGYRIARLVNLYFAPRMSQVRRSLEHYVDSSCRLVGGEGDWSARDQMRRGENTRRYPRTTGGFDDTAPVKKSLSFDAKGSFHAAGPFAPKESVKAVPFVYPAVRSLKTRRFCHAYVLPNHVVPSHHAHLFGQRDTGAVVDGEQSLAPVCFFSDSSPLKQQKTALVNDGHLFPLRSPTPRGTGKAGSAGAAAISLASDDVSCSFATSDDSHFTQDAPVVTAGTSYASLSFAATATATTTATATATAVSRWDRLLVRKECYLLHFAVDVGAWVKQCTASTTQNTADNNPAEGAEPVPLSVPHTMGDSSSSSLFLPLRTRVLSLCQQYVYIYGAVVSSFAMLNNDASVLDHLPSCMEDGAVPLAVLSTASGTRSDFCIVSGPNDTELVTVHLSHLSNSATGLSVLRVRDCENHFHLLTLPVLNPPSAVDRKTPQANVSEVGPSTNALGLPGLFAAGEAHGCPQLETLSHQEDYPAGRAASALGPGSRSSFSIDHGTDAAVIRVYPLRVLFRDVLHHFLFQSASARAQWYLLLSTLATTRQSDSHALEVATARQDIDAFLRNRISYPIGPAAFECVDMLGIGAFGRVLLVRHRLTGKLFAMKVVRKACFHGMRNLIEARRERGILEKMDCPYIIKLHATFQSDSRIYMLLDYLSGGGLLMHTQCVPEHHFSEAAARFYIAELAIALEHLRLRGIVHRDIKGENLVLDDEGHVILTDFGFAKKITVDEELYPAKGNNPAGRVVGQRTRCGTPAYIAPEVLCSSAKNGGYGLGVDWWSMGVVLFTLLTGYFPYLMRTEKETNLAILHAPLQFPPQSVLSSEAQDLLTMLLQKDLAKRIVTLLQLKQHPFFKGFDWEACEQRQLRPPVALHGDSYKKLSLPATVERKLKERVMAAYGNTSIDPPMTQIFRHCNSSLCVNELYTTEYAEERDELQLLEAAYGPYVVPTPIHIENDIFDELYADQERCGSVRELDEGTQSPSLRDYIPLLTTTSLLQQSYNRSICHSSYEALSNKNTPVTVPFIANSSLFAQVATHRHSSGTAAIPAISTFSAYVDNPLSNCAIVYQCHRVFENQRNENFDSQFSVLSSSDPPLDDLWSHGRLWEIALEDYNEVEYEFIAALNWPEMGGGCEGILAGTRTS